ncbi:MAG: TlpA disulfide reductase family protein [Gammaproteobacteria bacterium]|nr:TlpA disulfide reductase family protein [Gammaproteobacteria bacterium]
MRHIRTTVNHTPSRWAALAAAAAILALASPAALPADDAADPAENSDAQELEWVRADDLLPLLENHRGKVVLVNFWATWCGPCIHEIPALINLREKLDPSRFALVAISLDDQADAAWLVPEFIETRFPEWRSYLNGEFEDYLLVEELDPFWPGVMPANYVIGPDGSIVRTLLGGHSEEQFEEAVLAAMPAD